jgi:hypothetical protein
VFQQSTIVLTVSPFGVTGRDSSGGPPVSRTCLSLGHPRTLMGSFPEIAACFREILQEVGQGSLLRPQPRVVIHLPPGADGGYTDVEQRAFIEAALQAGARDVRITESREALNLDHIEKLFSASGGREADPAP